MNEVDRTTSPWTGTSPVASLGGAGAAVTLVEAQTFCVSGRTGDISPEMPHGLFVLDTRVVSCWQLRLNGRVLEPLTVAVDEPFTAIFASRGHPEPGQADTDLVCFRHRDIGQGMRERVVVTNHGLASCEVELALHFDVDFADVFEVKESRVRQQGQHETEVEGDAVRFTHREDGASRSAEMTFHDGEVIQADGISRGQARWQRTVPPGGSMEICTEVRVTAGGEQLAPRFSCGIDDTGPSLPEERMQRWRTRLPEVETDSDDLAEAVEQASRDLGALQIFDPEHPEVPILAAGAPWFMTVFGRDSLLTAWMTLLADPSLAEGVLETLARFQGQQVDAQTEQEPGKILHEMRFASAGGLALGGGDIYYGSVDATPLFVMLLDELRCWDVEDDFVRRMLPHADRAMEWIEHYGDRDGDGYVEYERQSPTGLANQGWKDSWDAIRHQGGELAAGPIALCEVQGYVYAAHQARACLARTFGDEATFQHHRDRAEELRQRFNEDFWLDEHGWFALALDGDKRPVEALASNMGHCLWTGIIDQDKAPAVAERLLSPELFSGWGIRTLATSMPAYNPVSYHNGSVWPHDNAICAAGLARYGFLDEAHRVIEGQLAVARAFDGRLPELFAGFDRGQLSMPAAYPTSCSPQAWASAAPLLWIRTLLGLDPIATDDRMWIDPQLPTWMGHLQVDGIRIADRDLTVACQANGVHVRGEGGLDVRQEDRRHQVSPERHWPGARM